MAPPEFVAVLLRKMQPDIAELLWFKQVALAAEMQSFELEVMCSS
jgi:hypothetical protein